jgi:hypothetical protein
MSRSVRDSRPRRFDREPRLRVEGLKDARSQGTKKERLMRQTKSRRRPSGALGLLNLDI